MLPTSIAGSIRITLPLIVSPADHRADVDALVREVAAGLDPAQVRVRLVGARDVAAVGDAVVEQDRHLRADRADVAGWTEPRRHLVGMGGAEVAPERAPRA